MKLSEVISPLFMIHFGWEVTEDMIPMDISGLHDAPTSVKGHRDVGSLAGIEDRVIESVAAWLKEIKANSVRISRPKLAPPGGNRLIAIARMELFGTAKELTLVLKRHRYTSDEIKQALRPVHNLPANTYDTDFRAKNL